MKPIFIYNTLSRQKEVLNPLKPNHISFYSCGPTVYNQVHIGNLRAYIFVDTLKRVLIYNGFDVNHIMNITDVDDKTIRDSKAAGQTLREFTEKYTELFFQDLKKLDIEPATTYPKATEYIPQMIEMIKLLIEKGFAYESEGSVYYDISKFDDYGKLAKLDLTQLKTGTRVDVDEYTRDSVNDFVLWKAAKEGEPNWESPLGTGRPGWHIECSAMSLDLLGQAFTESSLRPAQGISFHGERSRTIDIHAAGVDLIFPHNEDEIAQSEAATGEKFVNYWVHNEHLLVDGTKMSKSLNNFYTLADIEAKGFNPLAFRYLLLTAGYRDKINFTWDSLQAAQNALENLYNAVADMDDPEIGCAGYEEDFLRFINDDLDTPSALALMWKLIKSDQEPSHAKLQTILKFDEIFGLNIKGERDQGRNLPSRAQKLLEARDKARMEKDFAKSDALRDQLKELGIEVKDTPEGQKWSRLRHSDPP